MSKIPNELFYTKDHEWLKKSAQPKVVIVGVTDFAQAQLGDVTYVQLPAVGKVLAKGEVFGVVESVKTASDLYAPVSGRVTKVNTALANEPSPVNQDPYGQAWMIEIELSNESELSQLMSAQAYEAHAQ
jgi:glycine cleavage system H protein